MTHAIETTNLRREFAPPRRGRDKPPTVALRDLNLSVPAGETLGLLGPNGAGKTTLVKILSTILLPTSGSARVLGFDVVTHTDQVRQHIGLVLGGERGLYTRVSARQNLMFWAALYRMEPKDAARRCDELLERFGLADRANDPVERFSRGMKQRLHLARGMVHDPTVIFLDEPTSGLDPAAARELRRIITELKTNDRTILLATHDMDEAEALCDQVSLIDHGEIKAAGDVSAMVELWAGFDRIDFACPDAETARRFTRLVGVVSIEQRGEQAWRAHIHAENDQRGVLLRWLIDQGITDVQTVRPSLEEVYLHVLGNRGMRV